MGKKLTQEEVKKRVREQFIQNVELVGLYKSKRDPIELHCLDCGHRWSTIAQNVLYVQIDRAKAHCCPKCGIKTGQYVKCAHCGKEIYRSKQDIEKNVSGYFYCSRECGNRHKNLLRKQSGEWAEGSTNYRSRAMELYEHKCLCCGWDEDDRLLEAHHIDENRNNNHVDNLCLLCPTCHRKITLGYYVLDLKNKVLIKIYRREFESRIFNQIK